MYQKLNKKDRELLLKAPVYMSLLAAQHDGTLLPKERNAALKLSHIKTFSSSVELQDYFKDVEKSFEENLNSLDKSLPAGFEERKKTIEKKLLKIKNILDRIEYNYATKLTKNLNSFLKHVYKTHSNLYEVIVLPLFFDYINKNNRLKERLM